MEHFNKKHFVLIFLTLCFVSGYLLIRTTPDKLIIVRPLIQAFRKYSPIRVEQKAVTSLGTASPVSTNTTDQLLPPTVLPRALNVSTTNATVPPRAVPSNVTVMPSSVTGLPVSINSTAQSVTQKCLFNVLIYDKQHTVRKNYENAKVVRYIDAGSAPVQCGNCSVKLILGDERDQFRGMDVVVYRYSKGAYPIPPLAADMNPSQPWVFFTMESPFSTLAEGVNLKQMPVNAMWTYHRSSEIERPYGRYVRNNSMARKPDAEWSRGKTKLIVWMSSNCYFNGWARYPLVKQLRVHFPIDIFGDCVHKYVCRKQACLEFLKQYKFYLSFENAECDDYITEKVWRNAFDYGLIPIVNGPKRQFYETILPPKSFIYVGDYKTVSDLAKYIKLLDSKPDQYAGYFQWKYNYTSFVVRGFIPPNFCDLIPIIEQSKRGDLSKRYKVAESKYMQSCRKYGPHPGGKFGVPNWFPW